MKKTKFWLILIGILLLISIAAMVVQFAGRETGTAKIWLDGELLQTIDLEAVVEPYSFTVEGETYTNLVEVEKGRIRVSEAGCPDQVCVKQGWIADSATPIVCLPNGLVIEIVGSENGPDAIIH